MDIPPLTPRLQAIAARAWVELVADIEAGRCSPSDDVPFYVDNDTDGGLSDAEVAAIDNDLARRLRKRRASRNASCV